MGLPWAEHKTWTSPLAMPNGHALIQAHYPAGKEELRHVGAPSILHLADLPKLVNVLRRGAICEGEVLIYPLHSSHAHILREFERAWMVLLIKLSSRKEVTLAEPHHR